MGIGTRILVATAVGAASVCAAVTGTGPATAATTVRFQVAPLPFGNPNGSFDAAPYECVGVVGDKPGVLTVTGGDRDAWGCADVSPIHWVNLSTGATGSGRTSSALKNIAPHATLRTGRGHVALVLTVRGVYTPGILDIWVP